MEGDNETSTMLYDVTTEDNGWTLSTDIQDGVKDSVYNYWQFDFGNSFNAYASPIVVGVGFIGNILSFMVATLKANRSSTPTFYMGVLALLDSVMLIVGLLQYWIITSVKPEIFKKEQCFAMFFVINFFSNYSAWTVVLMTLERMVAVTMPLKSKAWCRIRNARISTGIIGFVAAAKNIHYSFTTDFVYRPERNANMCAFGYVRKGAFQRIWQGVDTALASVLPFMIILITNIVIIVTIRRQSRRRARFTKTDRDSDIDNSITVMLVTVSFMFVVLTAPLFIFRLYFTFVTTANNPYLQAIYNMGHHICHKLWYTNNAVNFYIYTLTGRKFRTDLKKLFCSPKPRNYLTNSQTSISTLSA